MSDSEHVPFEQSDCDVSRFAITDTIIFHREDIALKQRRHISKINAMPTDIGLPFIFVPLELHRSYCSYKM